MLHADQQLLVDLLNSRPVVGGRERDELARAEDGARWLQARGFPDDPRELEAVREARDSLRDVVRGVRSTDALQPLLVGVAQRPRTSMDGLRWEVVAPEGRSAAAAAVLAWGSLQALGRGRLRACENPECQLFLLDQSRANTGRWCSMAVCGNRMKARRHHQRGLVAPPPASE